MLLIPQEVIKGKQKKYSERNLLSEVYSYFPDSMFVSQEENDRNNAEKGLGSQGNQEDSVDIHEETLGKQRKQSQAIKITTDTDN